MELEQSVVPKVEKENPSTLEISEHIIPAIKEWDVGKSYIVKLSVEMVSINKGSMYNPNQKEEVRASFKVLGGQAMETDGKSYGNEEMDKKVNSKKSFIRAVAGLAKEYMEE